MSQLVFDEDVAREIEALYRIGDAVRRRRLVREALGARAGERVLDVGCGPGFYCAELLDEVGPDGAVVGVDPSAAMLALAARRCGDRADLREGEAVSLPVDDGGFDAAVCVQVLEYVADATAALAEINRALRPRGRAVVWDVDWATVSLNAVDRARHDTVMRAWDEHLAHPSLPRTLAARMRAAGFVDVRMEAHAFATADYDPDGYGPALIPFIGRFVADRRGLTVDDAAAWVAEQRELGERGVFYFASTQLCFTATKPG
jgi:arsenite methyltransferase